MNQINPPDFFQKFFPHIDRWDKKVSLKLYKQCEDSKICIWTRYFSYFADPRLWGIVGIVFSIMGFIEHDFSHLIILISGFLQSFLIYYIIKNLIKRERPFKQFESIERLDKTGHGYSFPSGHCHHSTILVGLLLLIFFDSPWIMIILIIYNFMVGISRVILGVHFITDTIVGTLEGYIMILLHWFFTKDFYLIFNQIIVELLYI